MGGCLESCRAARGSKALLPVNYLQEAVLLNELNRDVESARLRREGLPKLLDKEKLGSIVLCLMWTLHGEKDEGLLQSALAWLQKADESIQSHRIVDILRGAMMERVGRSSEARTIIDAVDVRGLTQAQLALNRLVKASVAASLDEKSVAMEHLTFASQWFQRECPASFAEGRPETFLTTGFCALPFDGFFFRSKNRCGRNGVQVSPP